MKNTESKYYLNVISYATFFYLAVFMWLTIRARNFEFFFYTIALSVLMYLFFHFQERIYMNYHIPYRLIAALSALGFLSLGGGITYIKGVRLLDAVLIPGILKYQDIMHIMFMFIMLIVTYILLRPYLLNERLFDTRLGRTMFYIMMILIVSGMGAIIEIIEFFAAHFLHAEVGGYTPNALDLLFNLTGAVLAAFFLPLRREDDPLTKEQWLKYKQSM